jgi:hypothetical protein
LLGRQELTAVRDTMKTCSNFLIEFLGLHDKNFLDTKQIPILSDRLEKVIKEIVEFHSQIISDEYDVISELSFVIDYAFTQLIIHKLLTLFDIIESLFYLRLQ